MAHIGLQANSKHRSKVRSLVLMTSTNSASPTTQITLTTPTSTVTWRYLGESEESLESKLEQLKQSSDFKAICVKQALWRKGIPRTNKRKVPIRAKDLKDPEALSTFQNALKDSKIGLEQLWSLLPQFQRPSKEEQTVPGETLIVKPEQIIWDLSQLPRQLYQAIFYSAALCYTSPHNCILVLDFPPLHSSTSSIVCFAGKLSIYHQLAPLPVGNYSSTTIQIRSMPSSADYHYCEKVYLQSLTLWYQHGALEDSPALLTRELHLSSPMMGQTSVLAELATWLLSQQALSLLTYPSEH